MIFQQKLKKIAGKYRKKIGKKTIKKIGKLLEERAEEIIKRAERNAGFAGRKIIKEEDVE